MALLKVWVDSKNMGEDHVLVTTIWIENRALLHYFRQDTELWSLDLASGQAPAALFSQVSPVSCTCSSL